MATRSLIKIEGFNIALYKHWDGHPESVLPWLTDFYTEFFKKRGIDHEYCLAQLVRSSVLLGKKHKLDDSNVTGYGIVPANSKCNQEYEYTLKDDGTIKVKEL